MQMFTGATWPSQLPVEQRHMQPAVAGFKSKTHVAPLSFFFYIMLRLKAPNVCAPVRASPAQWCAACGEAQVGANRRQLMPRQQQLVLLPFPREAWRTKRRHLAFHHVYVVFATWLVVFAAGTAFVCVCVWETHAHTEHTEQRARWWEWKRPSWGRRTFGCRVLQ